MALAMSKAAPLRPEIKLSQALKDYEAALTEDQKKSFRDTSPPESRDVMAFTFKMNRQNEGRKSRVWGARLTSFLTSVKGFTAVVDIIVGSLGNPLAGVVWGAVKLAIQTACTFESYYDALSNMLMGVGQSAPRYETYALLYPASAGLQKELCNYFSVVIDICKATVVFVRKPSILQAWDTLRKPFNDEFGKLQKDLLKFGDAVRDEVSLAAKQQQSFDSNEEARERKEISLFRRVGASFQKETTSQLKDISRWRDFWVKPRFLDSCSTYNHETALNQARRKGRSSWLFETGEYKEWKSLGSSSVFLCSGIVGAGKTIISSSVVEELVITRAVDDSVSYFFCRVDDHESLKAREIIGSLARQMLGVVSEELFDRVGRDIGGITLDVEQIISHLLRLLPSNRQYILVLDGLDECESKEAFFIFETLQSLLKLPAPIFKLFWTGRSDFIARVSQRFQSDFHVSISQPNSGPEISNFIELALDEALESGRLQLRDPEIIFEIQDVLEKEAQEMFLWMIFQIDSICRENTDQGVLEALEDLPKDMSTTYRRILRRLRDSGSTDPILGKKIFQIVTAARRPLSLEELREAISIDPGKPNWNPAKLVNDVRKSLDCCGSLVVVDDEFSTVHLAHSSVKQHLEADPDILDVSEYHINPKAAKIMLGEIVVTYLNLDVLQGQDTNYSKASTTSSSQNMSHLLRASLPLPAVSSSSLARRLLKNRRSPQFDVRRELEKVAGFTREEKLYSPSANGLLSYAQEHWIPHTELFEYLSLHNFVTYVLWTRLIEGHVPTVRLPWRSEDVHALNANFLELVAQSSNLALLQYALQKLTKLGQDGLLRMQRLLELLPVQDVHGYEKDDAYEESLVLAVIEKNVTVVRLLLDKTLINVKIGDRRFGTIIELALLSGNLDNLQVLFEHIDVNADEDLHRSLNKSAVISSFHEQAIPFLLARGVKRIPIHETMQKDVRFRLKKAYLDYDKKQQQDDVDVGL